MIRYKINKLMILQFNKSVTFGLDTPFDKCKIYLSNRLMLGEMSRENNPDNIKTILKDHKWWLFRFYFQFASDSNLTSIAQNLCVISKLYLFKKR